MILEILLLLSFAINVIFIFYCRWLINSYKILTQEVDQIQILISDFNLHLSGIYELEMFYGDETLSSLLEHGKQLSNILENIDLLEENDTEEDTDEEETEEN